MVLLAGPRQCGKTTLGKSLLDSRGQYLNWDSTKDRKVIRELAWPKDASLVVLDEFGGDALTARHYFYRLHPIDPAESKRFLPEAAPDVRLNRLLSAGVFPEDFLNPTQAARLRNDRMELVTREDLRDLSRVSSWRGPTDLIELLRERVGKAVNFDNGAPGMARPSGGGCAAKRSRAAS